MLKPARPVLILAILFLASLGANVYLYRELRAIRENPQKVAQEEDKALVARVRQLMVLPEDEEPTVATVRDPERLKDQPFFTKAKLGDKVLIYTKEKRAILFDPVSNRIVEVAPVNIGSGGDARPSTEPRAPANVNASG